MSAILGTFCSIKTMADGTPRITLDLQCTLAEVAALGLMPGIPFGIARITGESTIAPVEPKDEPKTRAGELCIVACNFCKDPEFIEWINDGYNLNIKTEEEAKAFILDICDIKRRIELDTSPTARGIFLAEIRSPFRQWLNA